MSMRSRTPSLHESKPRQMLTNAEVTDQGTCTHTGGCTQPGQPPHRGGTAPSTRRFPNCAPARPTPGSHCLQRAPGGKGLSPPWQVTCPPKAAREEASCRQSLAARWVGSCVLMASKFTVLPPRGSVPTAVLGCWLTGTWDRDRRETAHASGSSAGLDRTLRGTTASIQSQEVSVGKDAEGPDALDAEAETDSALLRQKAGQVLTKQNHT